MLCCISSASSSAYSSTRDQTQPKNYTHRILYVSKKTGIRTAPHRRIFACVSTHIANTIHIMYYLLPIRAWVAFQLNFAHFLMAVVFAQYNAKCICPFHSRAVVICCVCVCVFEFCVFAHIMTSPFVVIAHKIGVCKLFLCMQPHTYRHI